MKKFIFLIIDKIRKTLKVDEKGNSFWWGKGTLLIAALMIAGCAEKDSNGHIAINTGNANNPVIEIIDSCEYVGWGYGLAHKGNCRFCKERRQKELEELVIKLKEK